MSFGVTCLFEQEQSHHGCLYEASAAKIHPQQSVHLFHRVTKEWCFLMHCGTKKDF